MRLRPIFFLTLGWFGLQMALTLDAAQFQRMLEPLVPNRQILGLILGLGPLAGITVQPLVGWYGDRFSGRGVSKTFLLQAGVVLSILSTLTLAAPLPLLPTVALIALFFAAFNLVMVLYRARVTEVSSQESFSGQKGLISGFVALFSGAGSFCMFLLCAKLNATPYPFIAGAACLALAFALFFKFSPSPVSDCENQTSGTPSPAKNAPTTSLFRPWNLLYYALPPVILIPGVEAKLGGTGRQKSLFRLFLVVSFAWMGIQALRGFFVLYAEHVLKLGDGMPEVLLAVVTLTMLLSAIFLGKLSDRLDGAVLLRYFLLFFAAVCVAAYFFVNSAIPAIVMSVLLGVSFAGLVVFPMGLLFRLCPANQEGSYSGLYNVFISVAQLYSLLATGWMIDQFNDYRVILPVGAVAVFAGFLATFRMSPGSMNSGDIGSISYETTPR